MSDNIDRAAAVMDENFNPDRYPIMAAMFRDYARALDAAGLFASPTHDREVAAKAWDQGHTAGVRNASVEYDGEFVDNPYRKVGDQDD